MNELVKINDNNQATTSSLTVSEVFEKRHRDVLRSIKLLKCSKDFNERNFAPVEYVDQKGEKRTYYDMTRDGWTFLVMGFTGAKAAEWKEKYIAAFNAMEATVSKMETPAINMKAVGGLVKKCCGVAVRDELAKVKVVEYVNPIKNILSDDLLTEASLTPMEIETHLGHLLTGLWDYKKSSADMYKLYRLLEACKALACRYHSYANHLQGGVDFCEHYRSKNAKYFEMSTDALYATVRGMLDTRIELSAL